MVMMCVALTPTVRFAPECPMQIFPVFLIARDFYVMYSRRVTSVREPSREQSDSCSLDEGRSVATDTNHKIEWKRAIR